MDIGEKLSRSVDISERITRVLQHRLQPQPSGSASARRQQRRIAARRGLVGWPQYAALRAARGDLLGHAAPARQQLLEHVQQGQPPVLHFKHEMVLDGRTLQKPVNYALLRIIPPEGVASTPRSAPTSSSTRAAGTAPASAASRTTAGRRALRGTPGLLRHVLPRSGTRADAARRVRGGARVRAQGARAASGEPSPPSSATARAAGRR